MIQSPNSTAMQQLYYIKATIISTIIEIIIMKMLLNAHSTCFIQYNNGPAWSPYCTVRVINRFSSK